MKKLRLALLAATAVGGFAVLGLRVRPQPFPDYPDPSGPADQVPLPASLPDPVDRYYRRLYGDTVPVVHSAVITGRGRLRPFGLWLPARFRFTHVAGHGYRHYIEATWFGLPFMKVNERYLDGESLMEIPLIGTESGPQVAQAANLGMWAELCNAAPAVLVTDSRVRWEPVDDTAARLVVPLGEEHTDTFDVRFDPATGTPTELTAQRYRDSKSPEKIRWTAATEPGPTVTEHGLPAVGSAKWADQAEPWAYFETEDIRTNVDVSSYIRARGI